jgi:hypothetical protein
MEKRGQEDKNFASALAGNVLTAKRLAAFGADRLGLLAWIKMCGESGSLPVHPFGDGLDRDPDSLGILPLFAVVVLGDSQRPVIEEEAHA